MPWAGSWDQTPFLEAIQRQEFPLIIMLRVSTPFGPLHEIIWSPEMLAARVNECVARSSEEAVAELRQQISAVASSLGTEPEVEGPAREVGYLVEIS